MGIIHDQLDDTRDIIARAKWLVEDRYTDQPAEYDRARRILRLVRQAATTQHLDIEIASLAALLYNLDRDDALAFLQKEEYPAEGIAQIFATIDDPLVSEATLLADAPFDV